MSHRQAGQPPRQIYAILHLAIIILTIALSGCQMSEAQLTPDPDLAATQLAMPSQTPTPRPQPTMTQSPTPDCLTLGGELTSDHFFSTLLESDLFFEIYLPPCYTREGGESYPVVYLLHGLSYTSDQWPRLGLVETLDGLIASREVSPYIVVMPLEGTFTPPQTSFFGEAIVEELIPWMDNHYQTLVDAEYRAIGGVSRGAAWAVHLGFEYAQYFTKIGGHSLPLFEADEAWLLGWVTQTPKEDIPAFFIDIGRDDREWASAQAFADLLDEYSIAHEWYFFTGDHNEAYWSSHLTQYLTWYAQDW